MPEMTDEQIKDSQNETSAELMNDEAAGNVKPKNRKVKDFTPEEVEKIVTRIKEVGIARAAQEYGISTSLVVSLRRRAIIKSAMEEKEQTTSTPIPLTAGRLKPEKPVRLKRAKEFSLAERLAVIERSREVGAAQAAREAGISLSMVYNWTFKFGKMKPMPVAADSDVAQRTEVKQSTPIPAPAPKLKPIPIEPVKKPQVVKVEQNIPSVPAPSKKQVSALEIENIILKEKVQYLTGQLERLKAAITALMSDPTQSH